ncbi:MAG: carboxypeptidase-like regulatory domain-containing protein [Psychroflexus sp.]
MKKLFLIMISLAFLACGQDSHLVEGKITNNTGNPVENVLVQVMGTDLNTYSDEDGNFRINTRNRGEELIFTKKTYEMKRLSIKDRTEISVELQSKN